MVLRSNYKFGKPKRRNLDQDKVRQYLQRTGFIPDKITQEWRHLTAFGTYKQKPSVFKLASTKATSKFTRNEFNWNAAIEYLDKTRKFSFKIPRNYSSGEYNELFYLIMEKIPGEPIAGVQQALAGKNIPIVSIAKTAFEIFSINLSKEEINKLSKNNPNLKKEIKKSIGHHLLEASVEWAGQVPRKLDPFLEIIEKNKNTIQKAAAHGDFVLRQMFILERGAIAIIDGEHSSLKGPKFYDVAQFYIRTRNDHRAKSQATAFLKEIYKLLPKNERGQFWEELKPVLIERFIGDLWGAKNNPDKLDELEILGRDILEDRIIK